MNRSTALPPPCAAGNENSMNTDNQYTSSIGRRFAGHAAEDNSLMEPGPTRGAVLNTHPARIVY